MNPFKDLVDEVVRLGVRVAPETWSACLYIAASREFFRLGIACLEKMVETGTLPDGKAFNQIMACCEKKGRAEEAMYLYNFMHKHQIEVPPLTYWYVRVSRGGPPHPTRHCPPPVLIPASQFLPHQGAGVAAVVRGPMGRLSRGGGGPAGP